MTGREPSPILGRVQPAADLADRLPIRQAGPLVLVETLGLGIIFANSAATGARPLRVVGSYVIGGTVGLGVSVLPGPTFPEAVLAHFTTTTAVQALPLVVLMAAGVVTLAWAAHKVLGDAAYPKRWC